MLSYFKYCLRWIWQHKLWSFSDDGLRNHGYTKEAIYRWVRKNIVDKIINFLYIQLPKPTKLCLVILNNALDGFCIINCGPFRFLILTSFPKFLSDNNWWEMLFRNDQVVKTGLVIIQVLLGGGALFELCHN